MGNECDMWQFPYADPIDRGRKTLVMGILNMTPDSFSGQNAAASREQATVLGLEMLKAGADVLDIGAESSRPGATPLSAEEEIARLGNIVERLRTQTRQPISVDTYHPKTAEWVLKQGADIINDITALRGGWDEATDNGMGRLLSESGAHVVLMHMPCSPKAMTGEMEYEGGVVKEVRSFLEERVKFAEGLGIGKERVWLDVGFGFGKNFEQNRELLLEMENICGGDVLKGAGVLAGLSRKRMVGDVLGVGVQERMAGSLALAVIAALNKAQMIRVHDVRETAQALAMVDAVRVGLK